MDTERYADVIATGNLKEIDRLSKICLDKTNELKKFRLEQENDILEQSEMAISIIFARDNALWDYKQFVEYSDKALQEKTTSKNFPVYDNMQKSFREDIDKHTQKAESLRREFRNKYGY